VLEQALGDLELPSFATRLTVRMSVSGAEAPDGGS
jgi:hypothetical protein